jgi:hypothetical protein
VLVVLVVLVVLEMVLLVAVAEPGVAAVEQSLFVPELSTVAVLLLPLRFLLEAATVVTVERLLAEIMVAVLAVAVLAVDGLLLPMVF